MSELLAEIEADLKSAREHLADLEAQADALRLQLIPVENREHVARVAVARLEARLAQLTARQGRHRPFVVRNRRARVRTLTDAGMPLRWAVVADQHAHPEAWDEKTHRIEYVEADDADF